MQKVEYLENGIQIYQDDSLYTFTSDSILLSKFSSAKRGEVVADFCAGSGVVGFNFFGINADKIESLTFFEMQTPLYELSKQSIELNGLTEKVNAINIKLQDIPSEYNGKFSFILCNPPYMKVGHGDLNSKDNLAVCKSEVALSLDELVNSISRCLKFGGKTAICHRADRLVEVVVAMKKYNIEPKRLQFVLSKKGEPYLILIEGVKGGKSGIKILENIKN